MKFKIRSKQLKITVVKGQEIEIHTRTNSQGTTGSIRSEIYHSVKIKDATFLLTYSSMVMH